MTATHRLLAVFALWAVSLAAAVAAPETTVREEARSAYEHGMADWQGGRLAEAGLRLRTAAELAPRWPEAHAALGVVLQLRGKGKEARAEYAVGQGLSMPSPPASESSANRSLRRLTASLEGFLCLLINRDRAKAGLPPLLPDARLSRVAREHSREMRDRGYFSHYSPSPGKRDVRDRSREAMPRWSLLAENIAYSSGRNQLTEAGITLLHKMLMRSLGHRANLLGEGTLLGVGLAAKGRGQPRLTEVFARP